MKEHSFNKVNDCCRYWTKLDAAFKMEQIPNQFLKKHFETCECCQIKYKSSLVIDDKINNLIPVTSLPFEETKRLEIELTEIISNVFVNKTPIVSISIIHFMYDLYKKLMQSYYFALFLLAISALMLINSING